MSVDAVREGVNNSAMTPSQWLIVGLCMFFNVIDGLDAIAMAFTASSVSAEWALNGVQIGMLFSSGLFGMACGSMCAGPLANRYGRRALMLASVLLSGLSMLLSFWSLEFGSLMFLRGLTGMGVGATLVGVNVLTYEYASEHRRGLAIALQSVAFAMGGTLGGSLAHVLNESAGWRYVFLTGGCITLVAGLAGAFWLREPQACMMLKEDRRHARQQNADMPQTLSAAAYRQMFSHGQWQRTASLASAFFLIMFSFYFVISWTPTLLILSGFSEKSGIAGGMLLNIGGMLGALLVGLGANRFGSNQLLLGFLLFNAILMTLMVSATHVPVLAAATGLCTGLLLNGAIAALYTLAPHAFTTSIRASGVGLLLATGRVGAILSPVVAGFLLNAQWSLQWLFNFYAGSQLLAALLVWRAWR